MKYQLLLLVHFTGVLGLLKFPSYYADHMVLQRGPKRAIVWGHADKIGEDVTVKVGNHGEVKATISKDPSGTGGVWKAKLPAITDQGPFTLTVTSSEGEITLKDVLFGDVWVCSGQSNMAFKLDQVFSSTEEIAEALKFKDIRFMKSARVESPTPLEDLKTIEIPWTPPTQETVSQFSAVCFLFAEYLYLHLKSPLGLVESSWGGSPIEAWSSPDAIAKCQASDVTVDQKSQITVPNANSQMWNAMIHPLLEMTIFGALWYQGESNAAEASLYKCQFPAMISDWRKKFRGSSEQEIDAEFAFGFVQLAPNGKDAGIGTFPDLRWAQTYDQGFVPNEDMPKTFMAVAIDLPDFDSPFGPIHPRDKQDVSFRLMKGALAVAYGESDVKYQGPLPNSFNLDRASFVLEINYGETTPILVFNNNGFEVCCSNASKEECMSSDKWFPAPIVTKKTHSVSVSVADCGSMSPVGLRYEWRTSPCEFKKCAIQGTDTNLPAPPYITRRGF